MNILDFLSDHAEAAFGIAIVVAVLAFAGLLIHASNVEDAEHERLVSQCMADGHKEYQCQALLKRCAATQSDTVIMPIPVNR